MPPTAKASHEIEILAPNGPPRAPPSLSSSARPRGALPAPLVRGGVASPSSTSYAVRGQHAAQSVWRQALSLFTTVLRPIDRVKEELVESAVKQSGEKDATKARKDTRNKLSYLFFYCIFLLAYSVISMVGRNGEAISPWTIYDMQNSLMGMFLHGRGETLVDSATSKWSSNIDFEKVRTVEDIYTWFSTTFHSAVYTSSTFDGVEDGAGRDGFILGQQMLVGGITIRQSRKGSFSCANRTPGKMIRGYVKKEDEVQDERFVCYSSSIADTETFGDGRYKYNHTPSVLITDELLLKSGYRASDIGFQVVLPNRDSIRAQIIYEELKTNKFIDLQTRKIEVHATFWNFNVMRLTTLEFDFFLPISGGVFTTSFVRVADLYSCDVGSLADLEECDRNSVVRLIFEVACLVIITLQALLYFWHLSFNICIILFDHITIRFDINWSKVCRGCCCFHERRREDKWWDRPSATSRGDLAAEGGIAAAAAAAPKKQKKMTFVELARKVFKAQTAGFWFWQSFVLLQLIVYFGFFISKYVTMLLVPTGINIAGDDYIDFTYAANFANYADRINALFIFLSWVRLFEFINFFAKKSLLLFVGMFAIFLCGSAISNQIAFGYYIEKYSTFAKALIQTFSALRGQLPFDEMGKMLNNGGVGFIFAVVYIGLLIYIVFHLLLAIFFAISQYMKKSFKNDPFMSVILGKGGDTDSDDGDEEGGKKKQSGAAALFAAGAEKLKGMMGGDKGGRGGRAVGASGLPDMQKVFGMVEDGLVGFGMIGKRGRTFSQEVARGEFATDEPGAVAVTGNRDRSHTEIIVGKIKVFTEMCHNVGCNIFNLDMSEVSAAVDELLKSANRETGELSLSSVLTFFPSIGVNLRESGTKTIHTLFGRFERHGLLDGVVIKTDLDGNSELSAFGLSVNLSKAFVNIETLSIILLAALPLMADKKKIRDYLPQVTQLPVGQELARDLIAHVSRMLTGSDLARSSTLPATVVDGLDLIFNMMISSLDGLVSPDWLEKSRALISNIQSGVHALSEHPDPEVQRELKDYARELQKVLTSRESSKMDVAFQNTKLKRRMSAMLDSKSMRKMSEEISIVKEDDVVVATKPSSWGMLVGMAPPKVPPPPAGKPTKIIAHATHDKDVKEVDDFLSNMLHGGGDDSMAKGDRTTMTTKKQPGKRFPVDDDDSFFDESFYDADGSFSHHPDGPGRGY